jgi:molybdate transport system substrate-binding protein
MFAALLCLLLLAPAVPDGGARQEIVVFAAASLADALTEAGKAFEKTGGARIVFNFAGSNDLARQIEAGAPAHVFLSANREQVERLERSGKVRAGQTFAWLGNSLVVVVPRDSDVKRLAGAGGLLAFDRLSLADPEAVPAGVYAKAWLEREKVWPQLASRVVPALDVRAALAAVAAGNVPAGVVYRTDASSSDRVRVVYQVPADATPDLRYWAAPVATKTGGRAAAGFLVFLRGRKAREIFTRHGFTALDGR